MAMNMEYVAYYRVSTAKQGESGLGLEAQQAAVESFCAPVESFIEIETGKRADRPQLTLAIAACRRHGAVLVVAKLDRLARNVAFTSALMESGIEFVACDNPHATRLTVHILAAVAEDEARRISERTKAALAAYKARGGKLGNPNLDTAARRKGTASNRAAARRGNRRAREAAQRMRASGRSLRSIANELTGAGVLTRRGKGWSPTTIARLLAS